MRKVILCIVALLTATMSLPLSAQEGAPGGGNAPKATLEGVWQLCNFQKGDSGQYNLRVLPVVKVMNESGSYMTLLVSSMGSGCGIVEQGTFQKSNDSILVETPLGGTRPGEAAEPRTSIFHLQGPNFMVFDHKATDDKAETHEIWLRLRQIPGGKQMIQGMLNGKVPTDGMHQGSGMGGPQGKGMKGMRGQRGNRQRGNMNGGNFNQAETGVDNSWMNED